MLNNDKPKKKVMVRVPKDLELTKRYTDIKKGIIANTESKKGDIIEDKVQGISIDKKSSVATPKIFVRKVTTSPTTTKIVGTDGKVVYEGRNETKATKEALAQNEKHTKKTNEQRGYNANQYNVNTGSKENLTKKDKESLVSRKSANYR